MRVSGSLGAVGLSFTLLSQTASAQIVALQSQEHFQQTIQITGQFNTPPLSRLTVYKVPEGMKLRITDAIFTNYSPVSCDLVLAGATYEIRVQGNSSFAANFLSGPVYASGQEVVLDSTWRLPGHDTSCRPIYTLMGYLFK